MYGICSTLSPIDVESLIVNNERVMSRSPIIYANLKNLWRGNRVRAGMGNPFAYPASNSIPTC